jgi:hypothetical protein
MTSTRTTRRIFLGAGLLDGGGGQAPSAGEARMASHARTPARAKEPVCASQRCDLSTVAASETLADAGYAS